MFFKIKNSFDSHCHYLATGQIASTLSLKNLNSPEDVANLKIEPHHYQGEWLTGFGWDQNKWNPREFPTKQQLDKFFPNTPVFFSRTDGHASWINTKGFDVLRSGGFNVESAGVLFEEDHITALLRLPKISDSQIKDFLKVSQMIFNAGGFTHVRDLSMTLEIWNQLVSLGDRSELTIFLEAFCTVENCADLDRVFQQIDEIQKNPSPYLRLKGIKVFFDGALGSKTAYLSEPYLNSTSRGVKNWNVKDLETAMQRAWENKMEFAVHTIGDAAVHEVVQVARKLSASGVLGRLHLEHVQILRPETLQLLKPLHVTCHMQPCHWLSDQAWLKNVLPEKLLSCSFPWEAIRKNKIPLQFGSDSPIEPTSLLLTAKALTESAEQNWPQLQDDWVKFHRHPDSAWGDCSTEVRDGQIVNVTFNGKTVFKN